MMERNAVVLPGGRYGPYAPLLMFSAAAAQARSARIHPLSWGGGWDPNGPPPGTPHVPLADRIPWVRDHATPVLDGLPDDPRPLLIGKSLGTLAAPLAADRDLPAVWLTPLLHVEPVVAALRRGAAPVLLVGGTADLQHWDGALARTLSPYVLEIPEADHGMHVPGPLARSAEVLGRVATAVEEFLDTAVWP
ncbi:alpha/beta hydrolase [Plantactinospora sp. KBS50]|uniref:alpha/beta hydrolase n=1 Tax=Plantactinospora sp. KBS50 TaxID=2024580 RepID=UPI000BAAEE7E|nr:alpha/beta hydrolase [Plantactinospora sp. KBS50]ASW53462.1 hypothetical protein CIK06_03580 [Plantactinospora sp. KBS50]